MARPSRAKGEGEADSGPAAVPDSDTDASAPEMASSVLNRMLSGDADTVGGGLQEADVRAWAGSTGSLADGRVAHLAASCLLRPAPGDRVLAWSGGDADAGPAWVLSVLERSSSEVAVLASSAPLAIEAPRVGVSAQAVHIAAEDFITSTRHRHAVEDTRTETVRVRVAQVGTDIRRTETLDEEVAGTFLQRAGTWVSSTAREARLRARSFLFD